MISACFIVKNEQKWLEGCLANIRPIVSEIIIVDTGSTDQTKSIAEKFGARIFDFKWVSDFSAARNFAISHATQPWILNFDPDERVAEKDIGNILGLPSLEDADAFSFRIRNYAPNTDQTFYSPCTGQYPEFESAHPGYFETERIKLFRNNRGIHFLGAIHELVEKTVTGKVMRSNIPIHHFGELPEEKTRKEKHSVYFPILIEKAAQNPKDWKAHFELGCEYLSSEHITEASKSFEVAKTLSAYPMIFGHLGHCYAKMSQTETAEAVFKEGLSLYPGDHDIRFNYATMKMDLGQWGVALGIIGPLLKTSPDSFSALRAAGYCFLNIEKLPEARACIEAALKIFPKYEDARVDLGILRFMEGNRELAIKEAHQVLEIFPSSLRAKGLIQAIEQSPRST